MPEQIRCPDCAATLRVPDSLLGSLVKCPKCQTTFTAELPPSEAIRSDEAAEPEESPRRRPVLPDEESDDDESAIEDRPRRRKRRRRGGDSVAAESAVAGPAIAMMVSAGLGICSNIVYLVWRLFDLSLVSAAGKGVPAGYQAGYLFGLIMAVGGSLLGIIMCFVILMGAVKMKNLRSHGFAMTACILSMLPLYCCCLLGLPFGIWGLVVINNPDVKNAFT